MQTSTQHEGSPSTRILVLADTEQFRGSYSRDLSRAGFEVRTAADQDAGLELARGGHADVMILDRELPVPPTENLLTRLRAGGSQIHAIVVSACRSRGEPVRCLEQGADDYLAKPVSLDELCARIRTLNQPWRQATQDRVELDGAVLDRDTRCLEIGSHSLELRPLEYALLEILSRRRGCAFSRDRLVSLLSYRNRTTSGSVVEVTISTLRGRIRRVRASRLIHTRKGIGYYLR